MRYVSTRGTAPALGFEDVVLAGLAEDGGLYVPEAWPVLGAADLRSLRGLSYPELAVRVMAPYVGEALSEAELGELVTQAYATFSHESVTPLRELGENEWLLELFHGPTLAFKDCALQLLARLFDHWLARRGERVTIVAATSGDTGSAAIAACAGRAALEIVVLHPAGRVSEVQRRQMTTAAGANVHNIAVEGTFDDCQALVKAMLGDAALRRETRLAAVNSINWARVMAQIVYYVHAGLALGAPEREVAFAVPTGNFGDVFAGYGAHRMGLPIARLIVATNRNDILARFFEDAEYRLGAVQPTISPSMDIQVASNFERLLFELCGREGNRVAAYMEAMAEAGAFRVTTAELTRAGALFAAARVDEDATLATIASIYRDTGIIVDPHTAVGIAAGRARHDSSAPLVCLATAHPAKFPDAVEEATGVRPELPAPWADLFTREERYDVLANDLEAVKAYVREHAGAAG